MRLFVAVDVGDAVRAEAARVIQAISDRIAAVRTPPKITWVKPAALHVTLRFIGEVDDAAVPSLCERLAPPFALAPFAVEWRGLGAFPSARQPRALWLGVVAGGASLGALAAEVTRRLVGTVDAQPRPLAAAPDTWPHQDGRRRRGLAENPAGHRGARARARRWTAFTLYRSELSQRPRHELRAAPGGVEGRGPHYTGLVSAPLTANSQ